MSEIILKPCPFCKGAAKLTQVRGDNHNFWADGLFFIEVEHVVNPPHYICPLYAHQFGHYGGGYDKKAERYSDITVKAYEACAQWNKRADS